MKRCPITYELVQDKYSIKGLKLLSRGLIQLSDLKYTAEEQRHEAALRASKMSIQGVQPKLSAVLDIKNSAFNIVDNFGKFIIKPQHHIYPQLPENEDLTMKMASACRIQTPLHGLVYSKDGSLSYFIKRFDRIARKQKIPLEDFAQLAGEKRESKYNYSVEKLIRLIETYCTFPHLEKIRFFKRFLFNFLVGNEDMHLKNYSLISVNDKIELSPAYDFLNTTIVLGANPEESALTLKGKKSRFDRNVLIDYLAGERLQLNDKIIEQVLQDLYNAKSDWFELINISFLNADRKDSFQLLVKKRLGLLKI